jgi:glutathione S-transferase
VRFDRAAILFWEFHMTAPFRLYGAELSPYSIKVRAYLRFKKLAFDWLPRTNARQEEFLRYAKLPLIPVLVDAEENALQDSTPIIEQVEARFPEPSITPDDPTLAFVSVLLEDYADEWLNKAMFHYRWSYPEDQESAAHRIADAIFEGAEKPAGIEDTIRARMIGRLHHVGSSAQTAPVIEGSFTRVLAILDGMLSARAYLFGGRPSLADFGLAAQLTQLLSDPTPGAMIKAQAPNVVRWIDRMENPDVQGAFISFESARGGLTDLLREEVCGAYLPWMAANAQAVDDDAPGVSVEIAGHTFTQKPQRYAAKALAELRRKRALIDAATLAALLGDTGCEAYLNTGRFESAETDDADHGDEDEGDDGEDEE